MMSLKLHCWDGLLKKRWAFGWLTGKDNDLICVRPNISDPIQGEVALSPICHNPVLAIFAFGLKYTLFFIDENLYMMKTPSNKLEK